jgi:predicted transcriptional regulator
MSTAEISESLELLRRITIAVEKLANIERPKKRINIDDERAALAVVAIAKGAQSFAEIARELGISRATASRNPGIRRALDSVVVDRRAGEAGEAYQWGE